MTSGALRFEARVDARAFAVSLDVAAGETVAVLGPNGAGKSTLLDVIAGLLRPDGGTARLDDQMLFSVASGASGASVASGASRRPEAGAWLPPHRRGVSLLAQDPLLFPHLSVLDNVAFGPRSAGAGRGVARASARHWLGEVDALDLAARRPGELSGGQAQRVAVARALASDPSLLLLDEPLSALDVAVAPAVRRMLRRVLRGRSVVLVTHDVLDALTLADRVVVMNGGVVAEEGRTREVLLHPRTRFTADLAALNLFTGRRTATGLITGDGVAIAATTPAAGDVAYFQPGVPAAVAIRPSAVGVSTVEPTAGVAAPAAGDTTLGSAVSRGAAVSRGTVIRVRITDLEPRGDLIRVRSENLAADVQPSVVVDLDLSPGDEVWFTFDAADAAVYPL